MNAPILYIVLPAVLGAILAVFNRNLDRNRVISIVVVLFLALIGLVLPSGSVVSLGSTTIKVSESMTVLGRQFTITTAESPFIMLLYFLLVLWYVGTFATRVSRWLFPVSLIYTALLIAAISSEIFLFAAPLILAAVILSIPLLSPPDLPPGRGVVRYLVFQTLALPCVLLAGYILTGFETGPSDSNQALLSAALLGIGFAFLLGIFPFNTWLPQLFEEAPTYATAFIMVSLPMAVYWLMIRFIDTYVWIRTNEQIYSLLRVMGILMVLAGGLWSCFESNLKRMLAYAVMLDSGFMLLAMGTGNFTGLQVLSGLFMIRALNIGLASLSLAAISSEHEILNLDGIKGIFIKHPFAVSGFLAALLSMAGLPMLGGFPPKLVLIGVLGNLDPLTAILAVIGSIGLVIACLRILTTVYSPIQEKFILHENMVVIGLISAGIVFNILIALFPGALLTPFSNFLNAFTHLPR